LESCLLFSKCVFEGHALLFPASPSLRKEPFHSIRSRQIHRREKRRSRFPSQADSGHRTDFGECPLLEDEPPFLIGADPPLETQLSKTLFSSAALGHVWNHALQ
jgi:hypothetical protein